MSKWLIMVVWLIVWSINDSDIESSSSTESSFLTDEELIISDEIDWTMGCTLKLNLHF